VDCARRRREPQGDRDEGAGAGGVIRRGSHYGDLAPSQWQEQIDNPTLAEGILDRLVHNSHCIEMRGD
jgi:hypothetical protein